MKYKPLVPALSALIALCFSPPNFASWSADFEPPNANASTLKIMLPAELDIMILTTLGVELDGIDITALISFDNNTFIYTPLAALASGEHTLKLVQFINEDETELKNTWSFTVNGESVSAQNDHVKQQEKWLRSVTFKADTLTEFSGRYESSDTPVNQSIVSGSGNIQTTLDGENWSIDTRTNYIIQSDKNLALTGNPVDIGEYVISANYSGKSATTGFTLGHHDIGVDSLLFSSFQRRGVSAHIADNHNRISANAFAFAPQTLAGGANFTGLSNNHNRLEGVSATVKPFSGEQNALKVTGLYYDGEGSTGGIGISGKEDVSTGSGYGVIVEKLFFDGKINFRAEYARAQYDADGSIALAPEDNSNAMSMILETHPFGNLVVLDKPLNITIGAKYEKIDTFFQSLANQGIAADRDAIALYSKLYWQNFNANIQLINETNNVSNLDGTPTDEFQNLTWNSNYNFAPQTESLSWLGTPYLNFSGFVSTLERQDTPENYFGNDTNNASNSFTIGGGSNYTNWNWSASHTYATLKDKTDTYSDTKNNFTTLSSTWTLSERLKLNGNIQYGLFEEQDFNTKNYTTNINVGFDSVLIKNKLDWNLTYNLNLANGDNDSPDRHTINTELGWTIQETGKNHPGLSLSLRGSMEKTNANTLSYTNDDTYYQIFAVFRVTAPFSAGN